MALAMKKNVKSRNLPSSINNSNKVFTNNLEKNKKNFLSTVIQNRKIIVDNDSEEFYLDYLIDGTFDEANGLAIFGISVLGTQKIQEGESIKETKFCTHCLPDFRTLNEITINNGTLSGMITSGNVEIVNQLDITTFENEFTQFFNLFQEYFFVDEDGKFDKNKINNFFTFINDNHLEEEYLMMLQSILIEYNKYFVNMEHSMERPRIIFQQPEFIKKIDEARKSFELKQYIISSVNSNISRVDFEQKRYSLKSYIKQKNRYNNIHLFYEKINLQAVLLSIVYSNIFAVFTSKEGFLARKPLAIIMLHS